MSKAVYKFDKIEDFHINDLPSELEVAVFFEIEDDRLMLYRKVKFVTVYESAVMGKIILLGGE